MELPERIYYSIPELADRWKCGISDVLEHIVCGSLAPSIFVDDAPGWVIPKGAKTSVEAVKEPCTLLTGEVWFSPTRPLLKGSQRVHGGIFFSEFAGIPAQSHVIFENSIEASVENISIRAKPFVELHEKNLLKMSGPQAKVVNNAGATTERNTLYRMILGMAIAKYGYDPESRRNAATGENAGSISADLEKVGFSIDADTIREHLKAAYAAVPPDKS